MAITLNGVAVTLPTSFIPDGYTKIPVAKIATTNFLSHNKMFTIAKSGVENADELVTFQAIKDAVDLEVLIYLTQFFDELETINSHASWFALATNADSPIKTGYYTTEAVSYVAHVKIYVETIEP